MDKKRVFDSVSDFSEGLALVCRDGRYGFIDTAGREVVPCSYDGACDFREGLARVFKAWEGWPPVYGQWGFIDRSGREVIPCIYEQASGFYDGLSLVNVAVYDTPVCDPENPFPLPRESRWFYIDKSGREVLASDAGGSMYHEGLARMSRDDDGKMGFMDKSGKEVIPCKYDGVGGFSDGLAVVIEYHIPEGVDTDDLEDEDMERFSKVGVIDRSGREVIPCRYDDIGGFLEGMSWVLSDGKYGFVDTTGREVIPCRYDDAHDFHDGLARVQVGGHGLFIDRTGREAFRFPENCVPYDFSEGMAMAVAVGGKRGYIDRTGREVIPCRYDDASEFHDGLARVRIGDDGFFIDRTGRAVIEFGHALSIGELPF